MLALALSLGLFLYFAVVGRAALLLSWKGLGRTKSWLLGPAFGLAIVGLAIMVLNQAGLPCGAFARWLVIVSGMGSLVILIRKRVSAPVGIWGKGLALIIALVVSGWPLFIYGFSWVGYGNDDMANYCLGASRFLRHGFYAIPTIEDLRGGDYSQLFWMLHVAGQIRFGSEHILALVAGVTGMGTVSIFMPTLLALALVQLGAVMAMAGLIGLGHRTTIATTLSLGLAPLWTAGNMYQLIAQVGGLALLIASLAVIVRSRFPVSRRGRFAIAAGSAVLIAELCVFYPEVLPFLVLAWGLHTIVTLIRRGRWISGLAPTAVMTVLMVFVILRHNALGTTLTLLGQTTEGMGLVAVAARISLFPYFLIPSGPAFFFGFDVFVAPNSEPWSSVAVIAGFLVLAGTLVVLLFRRRPFTITAATLAVMAPFAILFFLTENGFALFKLAMFALPFLMLELAHCVGSWRSRRVTLGVLAGLMVLWLHGSWRYTFSVTNLGSGVAGELLTASQSRWVMPPRPAWSDCVSSPICKLLMLEAPESRPIFLSQLVGAVLLGKSANPFPDWVWRLTPGEATGDTARSIAHEIQHEIYAERELFGLHFWVPTQSEPKPGSDVSLVTSQAEVRSFNKLATGGFAATPGLFKSTRLDALRNHLIFVQSQEGQHYYLGAPGKIAVYRPQTDIYIPNEDFFAIGRHLLFRVINPSKMVRLRIAMTASILGNGRTDLPATASIQYGRDETAPLGLVGSGSANIYSPPLHPAWVNGAAYVAIDLGRPPIPLGLPAHKIKAAYNSGISLDTRLALGYCRDISLVDEATYLSRGRPRLISKFPHDLLGDRVEYSGIYEDGWMARTAFVVLGAGRTGDRLLVTGLRPELPGFSSRPARVNVLINGQAAVSKSLGPGSFSLEAILDRDADSVKVTVETELSGFLPDPDNRPVSLLLESIHLESLP